MGVSKALAREVAICLAYMERFTINEMIHLWKTEPSEPVKPIRVGSELDGHILKLAAEERASGRRLSEAFKKREFEAFKRMQEGDLGRG